MSIVEETLNRLRSEQTAAPAPSGGIVPPPSLGNLSLPGDKRRSALTRPIAWAGLLMISGALAWYAADRFLSERGEALPAATPAPAPAQVASEPPPPPVAPAAPEGAAVAASAPAPAPAPVLPAAPPAALLPAAASPPTVAASSPAAPSSAAVAPPVEAPAPPASAENRPALAAPAWVAEGRRQHLAGDRKAALDTWNAGFAALPDSARIVALSAHPDAGGAFAALSRLEDFDGAFVAHAAYRGKPAWRTLLFADAKRRGADMREAIARLGIKGGGHVPVARIRLLAAAQVVGDPPAAAAAPAAKPAAPEKTASAADFDAAAAPTLAALDRRAPEALTLADRLAHDFPGRIEPLLWRARAELLATQADAAEKTLAEAAGRAPGLAEVWLLRGIAAQERNRREEALGFLEEAYRLAPKNPDVLFNLAISARQAGAAERARAVAAAYLDLTREKPEHAGQRALLMRAVQP